MYLPIRLLYKRHRRTTAQGEEAALGFVIPRQVDERNDRRINLLSQTERRRYILREGTHSRGFEKWKMGYTDKKKSFMRRSPIKVLKRTRRNVSAEKLENTPCGAPFSPIYWISPPVHLNLIVI